MSEEVEPDSDYDEDDPEAPAPAYDLPAEVVLALNQAPGL